MQADDSPLRMLGNVYHATLRLPPVPFALSIFAAPILLSLLFTALYLFDLGGLYLDESASAFFQHLQGTAKGASIGDAAAAALALDKGAWDPYLLFELFMFSLSLATGLEPTIAPSSVYTQSLANLNALSAQLLFVFLSGAGTSPAHTMHSVVPTQCTVSCSTVACQPQRALGSATFCVPLRGRYEPCPHEVQYGTILYCIVLFCTV